MAEFEFDLDGEQVLFDGTWYSKDELARKIKGMVESGDFRVSRPSAALEALQATLGSMRTVTVRLPADVADALTEVASRAGQPVGTLVRDALLRLALPHGRPGVATPLPPAPPTEAMAVSTSDGVSAAEAAAAVVLKPKRRTEDRERVEKDEKDTAPVDGEAGWFTRR
jgi:hypothetical protein